MEFSDIAVVVTACRRPYYLERVLASWAAADGIEQVGRFSIALGESPKRDEQLALIRSMTAKIPALDVIPDSPAAVAARGMHRAIGEAATRVFTDPAVRFAVFSEEDVVVSSDALTYMLWAAGEFETSRDVLAVCAHSRGGQGWDEHKPAQDADADQAAVRLLPYFNAWTWGTWPDRWEMMLEPAWDWNVDSGGPTTSGWDWCIETKILPRTGTKCVVPDASRTQNIGALEGWASNEWSFSFSQAASFRESRADVEYRLAE
jgi:hypothetical protein